MSGYARPTLDSRPTLPPDTILLENPFTEPELLAGIDEALPRTAPTTIVQRSSNQ